MFAVIKTGGKQYRVEPGAVLNVEKLSGDVGQKIALDEVLLVANGADVKVGQPFVKGAVVNVEILRQTKGKKLIVFKKIRRHGKQLKKGHRQQLTQIRVADIVAQ